MGLEPLNIKVRKPKSWRFLYPVKVNGKELTFRERLIFLAGYNLGRK